MSSRISLLVLAASLATGPLAVGGELTKEECIDAHSRGQDAKEQNRLSLARKLFLTCAQPACPALVQGDCARFADDLSRLQPSITFVARDGAGADLPDTTVYIDGLLVATRIDGTPHDVDPGSHAIKFQSGGKEQVMTIVIGSGEKGRTVVATFGAPPAAAAAMASTAKVDLSLRAAPAKPETQHPHGAKTLMIASAATAVGGAGLVAFGMLRMPSNCSLSTNQCAAPPGDPSISNASSAAKMTDIGIAVGAVGLAVFAASTYWYVDGATTHKPSTKEHVVVTPWAAPSGGGVTLTGAL